MPDERKKPRPGQKVVIRNKYAVAEFVSLESASRALSTIGVLTADEVMKKLRAREGWINGFTVEYPET